MNRLDVEKVSMLVNCYRKHKVYFLLLLDLPGLPSWPDLSGFLMKEERQIGQIEQISW